MNKRLETPQEKEIKRVVKEYTQRMIPGSTTREGTTSDQLIDCPQCAIEGRPSFRNIELRNGFWQCLWNSCNFIIPEEFAPLSPREIKEIYDLFRKIKKMQIILEEF